MGYPFARRGGTEYRGRYVRGRSGRREYLPWPVVAVAGKVRDSVVVVPGAT
jgi:hypothetical protein